MVRYNKFFPQPPTLDNGGVVYYISFVVVYSEFTSVF